MWFIGELIDAWRFPKSGVIGSIPIGGILRAPKFAEFRGFGASLFSQTTRKTLKSCPTKAVCGYFVAIFFAFVQFTHLKTVERMSTGFSALAGELLRLFGYCRGAFFI
jgi:hypothetical protein